VITLKENPHTCATPAVGQVGILSKNQSQILEMVKSGILKII